MGRKKIHTTFFLVSIYFIFSLPKGTERYFISPYKLQNQKGDIFAQNATIFDYHPNQ